MIMNIEKISFYCMMCDVKNKSLIVDGVSDGQINIFSSAHQGRTLDSPLSVRDDGMMMTFTHQPFKAFNAFKALQSQSKLVCPSEHISGRKGGQVPKLLILGFLLINPIKDSQS